jgi:exonuclease III
MRLTNRAGAPGWRIDYCLVSKNSKDRIGDIRIRDDVFSSDHCPV